MRYFMLNVVDIDEANIDEHESEAAALSAAAIEGFGSIAGPFVLSISDLGQCKIEYVSGEEDDEDYEDDE